MASKKTFHLLRLFTLSIILFSCNVFAAHALPEFDAKYAIQKYSIKLAEAQYRLNYTNKGYKFTQNTKLFGVASLFASDTVSAVSYVEESGDNLLLTKHIYTQTGREKNRDEDIDILWTTYKTLKGKISGVVRGKNIDLRTDTEIWDVLSFQIPLMIEANENVKEYPYKAIIGGEIDDYNFVLTSSKKIAFAGKVYKAIQLVRSDPDRNWQLHIWLIPALHNIPVLIENYRDGKEHSRMQLENVNFNHKTQYVDKPADNDDDDD